MRNQQAENLNRRQFMQRASFFVAALPALQLGTLFLSGCNAGVSSSARANASVGDTENLSWHTTITAADEPGEPLIITGTVYAADGVKPLEGIILYVYHTDARGYYSDQDGNGREPQPRLKGRVKTNAEGRYEFRTIRPAPYPNHDNPAHIHGSLAGPGYPERWIESYRFEGDPLLTAEFRSQLKGTGKFSPVVTLQRGSDGVWKGVRDLKLASM